MTKSAAHEILALARQAHDLTEAILHGHGAAFGQDGWDRRQRFLLADMAIHLLQTALRDGDLDTARLRTNLYSVLTVSAQVMPDARLKHLADRVLSHASFDPTAAALHYLAAYQAKDLGAIGAMLAPDVSLQDWNIAVSGKDAFLAETRKNFDHASSLSIDVVRTFTDGLTVAAQLLITVDGSARLDVVDVLTFNAAGELVAVRAYKG